jgi:hypothetical protein
MKILGVTLSMFVPIPLGSLPPSKIFHLHQQVDLLL